MKKLILIDGNAIVHRAFHALPPLTNSKGQMLNAVYGFFSMLISLLNTQKPDYLIVCFDKGKPTFRQAMFVGYQQHRPKISDDLVPQIQIVHDLLEKMNVRIFEIEGYEADDIIGTIATKLSKDKNIEVLIVSGDRDLLQLVRSKVKMFAPVVGLSNIVLYDEAKVEEKFGVKPRQIIDYKALVGDASDGYPGVSGIGPKTASDLLKKYKTFENLYKNVSKLPPKIGEKLAVDAEQASLAKKLATIVTDAPVSFDLKKSASSEFDIKGAKKAFEDLGFKSLIKRLESLNSTSQKEKKSGEARRLARKKGEQLSLS